MNITIGEVVSGIGASGRASTTTVSDATPILHQQDDSSSVISAVVIAVPLVLLVLYIVNRRMIANLPPKETSKRWLANVSLALPFALAAVLMPARMFLTTAAIVLLGSLLVTLLRSGPSGVRALLPMESHHPRRPKARQVSR